MEFYFFLFVFLMMILALSCYIKKLNFILSIIFFMTLFLVAALRGDVGQDTFSYGVIYSNLNESISFLKLITRMEPFLPTLMYIHKIFHNSYTSFLILVSFLQISLLYYATRNLQHKFVFFFFYLIIFFLEFHFNTLRAAFGVLFFLSCLSVIDKSKSKAFAFLILSLVSHASIFVLLPIIFFRLKMSLKRVLVLTFISLCIAFFAYVFLGDLIVGKVKFYQLTNFGDFRFPLAVSFLVLVVLSSLFISKNVNGHVKFSILLFLLFFFSSSFSDIAYRFYLITLVVSLFLILENKVFDFSRLKFKPYFIGMALISFWCGVSFIYSVSNEKSERLRKGVGDYNYSFAPYSFYFESNDRK